MIELRRESNNREIYKMRKMNRLIFYKELPWWLRQSSICLQCGRPGLGRSPGEGNGNPLQYYCLENPMDRGAWQATVYGVAKSQTRVSNFTFTFYKEVLFMKKNLKAHIQKKLFSLIRGIKFTIHMLFKLPRVSMAWKTVILIPFFTKTFITTLEKYVQKI